MGVVRPAGVAERPGRMIASQAPRSRPGGARERRGVAWRPVSRRMPGTAIGAAVARGQFLEEACRVQVA